MAEVKRLLSRVELADFEMWMYGQTCGLTRGGKSIFYTDDVLRFLNMKRNKVDPGWD